MGLGLNATRSSMKADLELVKQVKEGDQAAFGELVKRHQRSLLRVIWRMVREQSLAEDIVQEAFVKAYQKIHYFEERSSFKSWMYRIAFNTASNKLRGMKREGVNVDNIHLFSTSGAEQKMMHDDLKLLISKELAKLPDRQRTALTLRIFEDMSFQEIAVVMDCPYDTAKANYRHGLLKIRDVFEKLNWVKDLEDLTENTQIKMRDRLTEVES